MANSVIKTHCWKYHNSVNGNAVMSLPNNWEEINIVAHISGNTSVTSKIVTKNDLLNAGGNAIGMGYYLSDTDNLSYVYSVHATNNTLQLLRKTATASDDLTTYVYYR